MDSLRYWVQEMHVDGFRFDLAAALGRGTSGFDPFSAFLDAVGQDPILQNVKLIAEPWDIGAGGYEVGDFPAGWSEWNGRYRDTVRDFWRGRDGVLPDFATRLAGSSDLYGHGGRRPTASVNIVTVHDGFTLTDLVSYDRKHNEANGENNRDGSDDNRSWNCGVEGPSDDPEVTGLRARQRRNLLATLLLSQGVPMLLGGDELGATHGGNNNAYCQDNETNWLDWTALKADGGLVDLIARLTRLRHQHPDLRRTGSVEWLRPDGRPMDGQDWQAPWARAVTVAVGGQFVLMVNGWWEPLEFSSPAPPEPGVSWVMALDTASAGSAEPQAEQAGAITVAGRSLVLLQASVED
jgi:glycogen operon protein